MSKFKVVNGRFEGIFEFPFIQGSTDFVNFCNITNSNKDITDEELTQIVNKVQTRVNENSKFMLDSLSFAAVKYLAEDEYNIYHACDLGIIDGDRDEVLDSEKIEEMIAYAESVNLNGNYVGYAGDMTGYIEKHFPELDLDLIVLDYDFFEGIMLHDEDGGFTYTPDGDSDVWEGDNIEFDHMLEASICRH